MVCASPRRLPNSTSNRKNSMSDCTSRARSTYSANAASQSISTRSQKAKLYFVSLQKVAIVSILSERETVSSIPSGTLTWARTGAGEAIDTISAANAFRPHVLRSDINCFPPTVDMDLAATFE